MTDVIIFHFGLFLAFYPPKKRPGEIIILHMCTKYYDQMMYGVQQTDRKSDI